MSLHAARTPCYKTMPPYLSLHRHGTFKSKSPVQYASMTACLDWWRKRSTTAWRLVCRATRSDYMSWTSTVRMRMFACTSRLRKLGNVHNTVVTTVSTWCYAFITQCIGRVGIHYFNRCSQTTCHNSQCVSRQVEQRTRETGCGGSLNLNVTQASPTQWTNGIMR